VGDAAGSPGTLLAFEARPEERRGRWGVGGVHHVALGTSDEAALLRWKRRLTDRGVAVTGPYDRGWFHSIYFTDPDGQILEIATAGPGYALDEPQDALGEQVIDPSATRLRGARDEAAIAAATHPDPVDDVDDGMALTGIHHVTGITGAIEDADAFYTRALGLRIIKKTVNQDDPSTPHWFWGRYDGGEVAPHSAWTLFGWRRSDYTARPGVGQLRRMAFRAADAAELDAWREHLAGTLGLEVGHAVSRGAWLSLPFSAPDGQALEVTADV
jgi:glyoxalase family protein